MLRERAPVNLFATFLGAMAILAMYVAHTHALNYIGDDAYISFHYARNFAEGHGLVYNLGERVEGYTNFLWVIMLAAAAKLWPSLDMLMAARGLSVVFGAAVLLLLTWHCLRRERMAWWIALTPALILSSNTSFCAWTYGALESNLFALCIVGAVLALDREFRGKCSAAPAAILAGLAALTRADGFIVFVILTLARIVEHFRRGESPLNRRTLEWCGVFLLIAGSHIVWRLWYYGDPLPNTFYAKVGGGLDQYIRGARYVRGFAAHFGGSLLAVMLLFAWVSRSAGPSLRFVLLLVIGWIAYVVKVGGDGLAHYRFLGFIMPLMALAAAYGIANLHGWMLRAATAWRAHAFALFLILLVTLLGAQPTNLMLRHGDSAIAPYNDFDQYFVARCAAAGRWLNVHAPAESVVASTPAGAVAFFGRRTVIDMLGLTDRHIARVRTPQMGRGRAGHEKGDGAYVLSRAPDYILLGNVAVGPEPYTHADMQRELCQRSERELWNLPEFHEHYELRAVPLDESGAFRWFSFYQRKQGGA